MGRLSPTSTVETSCHQSTEVGRDVRIARLSLPRRTVTPMSPTRYNFKATLWPWKEHEGSWWFVTVPEDVSDEIDDLHGGSAGGFGSIKVEVTVGGTTWRTSLFPSSEQRAYVLPVKKAVRVAETLMEDQ